MLDNTTQRRRSTLTILHLSVLHVSHLHRPSIAVVHTHDVARASANHYLRALRLVVRHSADGTWSAQHTSRCCCTRRRLQYRSDSTRFNLSCHGVVPHLIPHRLMQNIDRPLSSPSVARGAAEWFDAIQRLRNRRVRERGRCSTSNTPLNRKCRWMQQRGR